MKWGLCLIWREVGAGLRPWRELVRLAWGRMGTGDEPVASDRAGLGRRVGLRIQAYNMVGLESVSGARVAFELQFRMGVYRRGDGSDQVGARGAVGLNNLRPGLGLRLRRTL